MHSIDATENVSFGRIRTPASVAAVTISLVILLFWPTAQSILNIWSKSETFTHGYFVLPVFVWLTWRCRQAYATELVSPDLLALIPLAASGAMWLLSKLAGIQVGEHLALAMIMVFSLWAVLGRGIASQLKFPLLFLLFLAPVGAELVPLLMEVTADMTVWAIRHTGIPIYREGLFFSLPSGNWSVVEACSGIRYLIASAVLGSLFAYLSYTSMYLRLFFFAVSLVLPILANSVRAYIIVMLGHFSGNKLATGVDHLVYGWLFFGIVMFALFSVGSVLQRYDSRPDNSSGDESDRENYKLTSELGQSNKSSSGNRSLASQIPAMLAVLAMLVAWPIWSAAIERSGNTQLIQSEIAQILPEGVIVEDADTEIISTSTHWQPFNVGHDLHIEATYNTDTLETVRALAFVYIDQRQGKEMISSNNTLVTNQSSAWRLTETGLKEVSISPQKTLTVRRSTLSANNNRLMVWQWYRVGEVHATSGFSAKLLELKNKLLLRNPPSISYMLVRAYEDSVHDLFLTEAFINIMSSENLQ